MSKQGLLPIPIDDISASLTSVTYNKTSGLIELTDIGDELPSLSILMKWCKNLPLFRSACFHSKLDSSSVHACLISSDMDTNVYVSPGLRFRNHISNFVLLSPTLAVNPMSLVFILFLYTYKSRFYIGTNKITKHIKNETFSKKKKKTILSQAGYRMYGTHRSVGESPRFAKQY